MRKANRISKQEIQLPFKIKKPVLALGSQSKNTLCFAKGNIASISREHPDLGDLKDFLEFKQDADKLLKKRPKIVAFDLHPEYQSTKYLEQLQAASCKLQAVQHHHAHIASCMAENGLKNQKVIGVAFDGTGMGGDNTLWGAEFLVCDYKKFTRKAHLREATLLGGEKAILEPWRLACFWLGLAYRDKLPDLKIAFVKNLDKKKWRILQRVYLSGFDFPRASSMGRLFDAASSLILARYKVNFEAELAMELERMAASCKLQATGYKLKIAKKEGEYIIDPLPVFEQIVADLIAGEPKGKIAYRFHLTIAEMIRKTCLILRKENNIKEIVLSGGVFQNKLLLNMALDLLYKEGFSVFTHKQLSCNDSSLSLGQAVIVSFRG